MPNLEVLQNQFRTSAESRDFFKDYEGSRSYICEAITERADSQVDIYNADLLDWAKYHLADIDEAADELGKPDSFIGYIQQAQFIVKERELYEDLENGILWACYEAAKEYAEEITEEQNEAIEELADSLDNNSRFDDITDGIQEIFEGAE